MAVVSVRLNDKEEEILNYLTEYFHDEKSSLLKKSMFELYKDIQDIKFVDRYFAEKGFDKKTFISGDEQLGRPALLCLCRNMVIVAEQRNSFKWLFRLTACFMRSFASGAPNFVLDAASRCAGRASPPLDSSPS